MGNINIYIHISIISNKLYAIIYLKKKIQFNEINILSAKYNMSIRVIYSSVQAL